MTRAISSESEYPSASRARRYDPAYVEDIALADGTRVRLRTVRASDRETLARGFSRLSAASRQSRFFGAKPRLSEAEIAYLTDVDGEDHFAIGAVAIDDDGTEADGVAVARFVRDADGGQGAEAAIAVLDELQGRGLGRALLRRLTEAATERGVQAFHCEVLAPNAPMRALIDELAPGAPSESDGEVVRVEIPLRDVAIPRRGELETPDAQTAGGTWPGEALRRAFALAAKGSLVVRRLFVAAHPRRDRSAP